MKANKIRAALLERQKAWDMIKDPKAKAATRRPGSLNGKKTGTLSTNGGRYEYRSGAVRRSQRASR